MPFKYIKLGLILLVFIFGIGLGLLLTPVPTANAALIGWKFNTKFIYVSNQTTRYGTYISNAVSDYYYNTNLDTYNTTGSTYQIGHVETYDTNVNAWAWTMPNSNGTNCFSYPDIRSTGYCNTTNHQVNFSWIYWNNSNIPWTNPPSTTLNNNLNFVARHEMGHAFGLKHENESNCTSTYSIMQVYVYCSYSTPSLQANPNISDINGLYP